MKTIEYKRSELNVEDRLSAEQVQRLIYIARELGFQVSIGTTWFIETPRGASVSLPRNRAIRRLLAEVCSRTVRFIPFGRKQFIEEYLFAVPDHRFARFKELLEIAGL